jgi:hypothetical protein
MAARKDSSRAKIAGMHPGGGSLRRRGEPSEPIDVNQGGNLLIGKLSDKIEAE